MPQYNLIPKYDCLRPAQLDDVPFLIEKASEEFKTSPYARMDVDLAKARQMLEKFIIEGQKDYLVLVADVEKKPVGVIAAYVFAPIFSQMKVGIEVLFFVEKDFRTSKIGSALMDAYEYWAKLVGCRYVQYGHLVSSPEGMKNLYERRGCYLTENVYQKVLE